MNVTHLTIVHQILVFDVISTSNYKHNRLPRIWQNILLAIIGWSWVWYGELCRSRGVSLFIQIFPSPEQAKLLASLLSSKVRQIQDMKGTLFLADNFHIAVAIGRVIFLSILATFLRRSSASHKEWKFPPCSSALYLQSSLATEPFACASLLQPISTWLTSILKHLPNLVNASWLWRIGRGIFWINNKNHRTIKFHCS